MKHSSIGTKLLLAAVTAAVLAYFAFGAMTYFSDPLTTTPTYTYQVETTIPVSGYVVRREQVLPDESSGLLRLQRALSVFPTAGPRLGNSHVSKEMVSGKPPLFLFPENIAVYKPLQKW